MIAAGFKLTYWAKGLLGREERVEDAAGAEYAIVELFDGLVLSFEFPAERVALARFEVAFAAGVKLGRWQKINEVRAALGNPPLSNPNKVP